MEAQDVPPGHRRIRSEELTGEALAWAVCALYRVPAAVFDDRVHVEIEPGNWQPFDAEAMLRSLVCGHAPEVLVPDALPE